MKLYNFVMYLKFTDNLIKKVFQLAEKFSASGIF